MTSLINIIIYNFTEVKKKLRLRKIRCPCPSSLRKYTAEARSKLQGWSDGSVGKCLPSMCEDRGHEGDRVWTQVILLRRQFRYLFGFYAGRWWRTPVIPALGRQRQADFWVLGQPGLQSEFQDSQGYTEKPLSRKTKKKKKKEKKDWIWRTCGECDLVW